MLLLRPVNPQGTYALSAGYYDAYYGQAQKVRTLIQQDFVSVFDEVDMIAAPVAPTIAMLGFSQSGKVFFSRKNEWAMECTIASNQVRPGAINERAIHQG